MRVRPQPARRLEIPAGFYLTDADVRALLTAAELRKRGEGESLEPTITRGDSAYDLVRMPVGVALDREDLIRAITRLNDAAEIGHADVLFTFADGRLVKRGWITDKRNDFDTGGLRVGGRPMPKEY